MRIATVALVVGFLLPAQALAQRSCCCSRGQGMSALLRPGMTTSSRFTMPNFSQQLMMSQIMQQQMLFNQRLMMSQMMTAYQQRLSRPIMFPGVPPLPLQPRQNAANPLPKQGGNNDPITSTMNSPSDAPVGIAKEPIMGVLLDPLAHAPARDVKVPQSRTLEEQAEWSLRAFERGQKAEYEGKYLVARACYENAANIYPDAPVAVQARQALEHLDRFLKNQSSRR